MVKVARVKNPRSRKGGAVAKRGTKRVGLEEARHAKRAKMASGKDSMVGLVKPPRLVKRLGSRKRPKNLRTLHYENGEDEMKHIDFVLSHEILAEG